MAHHIRPFEGRDRAALVEIGNRDRPAHRHQTVANWERNDARRPPDEVFLRLVAADPDTDRAVAYLDITDLNTASWKMEDVCGFGISVAHECRRQGLGAALYDRALAFAQERGAKRLVTGFAERRPDEPAIAFLTRRGFTEQEREKPSYLDLPNWDPTPFLPAVENARAHGIRFVRYADVPDTEENRRRLYDLFVPLIYDIPRRDDQPFTVEGFESWVKSTMDRPEWTPELMLLAETGDGQWVGMCHVMPKVEGTVAMQWLTGVLKDHRGQGIATAVKTVAYQAAQARGHSVITTENHEDNAPMLAVNKKFGFRPEPTEVSYNKVL